MGCKNRTLSQQRIRKVTISQLRSHAQTPQKSRPPPCSNKPSKTSKTSSGRKPVAPDPNRLLRPRGDYQTLLSFQKAEVVYDITFRFAHKFLSRGDCTIDQMIQSARSCKQNILEASKAATTSKKMEIKLTNVGRASLEELLADFRDYLRVRDLPLWPKDSKEGSLVMALTRTIISGDLKVAIIPEDFDDAFLNQRLAAITPDDLRLNSEFLFAYLSTQSVIQYVAERVNTLMQPNLSMMDLRAMPIPMPPKRQQDCITLQIQSLREETQRLESIYRRKLAALDDLKKSLLRQAFSGEL